MVILLFIVVFVIGWLATVLFWFGFGDCGLVDFGLCLVRFGWVVDLLFGFASVLLFMLVVC